MDQPARKQRERFWPRQFSTTISSRQMLFDVVVGAIVPILLLIFDPVVFHNQGICYGIPTLLNVAIFAYTAIGLGVLALLTWLFVKPLRQNWAALFAGILLTGGMFSTVLGISLLPVSLLGLVVCIGALGFFPFVTAFVYFRNGIRACRLAASVRGNMSRPIFTVLAGCLLVLGIPALVQSQIPNFNQQAIAQINSSSCINAGSE